MGQSMEVSHAGVVGHGVPTVIRTGLKRSTWEESKKLWYIAGPAILTSIFQTSIGLVTVASVGRLGKVELAAVSIVQNVLEGFAYGILLGMGSALETLCGQAFGAGQLNMLGIYMQRSWVITMMTALLISPLYIFSSPILKAIHQAHDVADMAGRYSIWVLPQLFAYAVNFPLQKFYQSQSRVTVITVISGITLCIHVVLNWFFVTKLGYGLIGAAFVGNFTWWIMNWGQFLYLIYGKFHGAWTGFSWAAFHSLGSFIKLSLASAAMLCLELWYFSVVLLLVGLLKNPELAVDAIAIWILLITKSKGSEDQDDNPTNIMYNGILLGQQVLASCMLWFLNFSICGSMNLELWTLMIALGFNVAVSVRVSNELGASRPEAAKFSVIVGVSKSLAIGVICTIIVFITKDIFPRIFTTQPDVIKETARLAYLLAITIALNSVQPVLSGVAVGAGWQSIVAYVNIGSYYLFGLPIGALLGFKFNFGVVGIWCGMLAGCSLQTIILLIITIRTNWEKEAMRAEKHIKKWGGQSQPQGESEEHEGLLS